MGGRGVPPCQRVHSSAQIKVYSHLELSVGAFEVWVRFTFLHFFAHFCTFLHIFPFWIPRLPENSRDFSGFLENPRDFSGVPENSREISGILEIPREFSGFPGISRDFSGSVRWIASGGPPLGRFFSPFFQKVHYAQRFSPILAGRVPHRESGKGLGLWRYRHPSGGGAVRRCPVALATGR